MSAETPSVEATDEQSVSSSYEQYVSLASRVFGLFYEYRPSHVQAFIVSFLCVVFSVGVSMLEYNRVGRAAFVDTSLYFLMLAILFFLMGRAIRREGSE
jgi:hypothetical protein